MPSRRATSEGHDFLRGTGLASERAVFDRLVVIGAPSSAGAYAPGQEKAPAALRAAGLLKRLSAAGITVEDRGDVHAFRWRADKANPRAMNVEAVSTVVRSVADHVAAAMTTSAGVLVLGGDCTIELGVVAGALRAGRRIGVVYIDLDTDLNTPESTRDGALDWMGVAHMLGIDGTIKELCDVGPQTPMLRPEQLHFFATGNVEPNERQIIDRLGIAEIGVETVRADPAGAANAVVNGWAQQFERLLIHVDVDVLDFADMPLAENTRRNAGLRFDQLMEALRVLLAAPNWATLTICELNPDHGESDGSTLQTFATALTDTLIAAGRLRRA